VPEPIDVDLVERHLDNAPGRERDPVEGHLRRPPRSRSEEPAERAPLDREPGAPRMRLDRHDIATKLAGKLAARGAGQLRRRRATAGVVPRLGQPRLRGLAPPNRSADSPPRMNRA